MGESRMESRDASGAAQAGDEQEQRLGAVFWVTVAISAAFVLWGVLFTTNFTSTTGMVVGWITEGLG